MPNTVDRLRKESSYPCFESNLTELRSLFVAELGKASIKVCDFASLRSLSLAAPSVLWFMLSILTRFYASPGGPAMIIGLIVLCSTGLDMKLLLAYT